MGRTFIIGDIHGCIDELTALYERLDPQPGDRVVSAGDLVHKGPHSGQVVAFCRTHGVELTLGNHELQQNRFRKALSRIPIPQDLRDAPRADRLAYQAGKIKLRDDAARAERLATELSLSDEDVAYMESGRYFVQVPGGITVHAGVLPTRTRIPSDEEIAGLTNRERRGVEMVTRVRRVTAHARTKLTLKLTVPGEVADGFGGLDAAWREAASIELADKVLTPAGSFISLGQHTPDDPFWAEVYDGRFGQIYFGHDARIQDHPRAFPHATGLDTACVSGGWLTAAVIDDDGVTFVSEPARAHYTALVDTP